MNETMLKVHGSGNTFYLYEAQEDAYDWVQLAKWLCDSKNEQGADGLLLVLPSTMADAKMRVINADGSEASMCGNGLRCVARYVCDKLGKDAAIIETMHANLFVQRERSIFGDLPTFSVEISPISFELKSLPMYYKSKDKILHELVKEFSPDIHFTAISVPNPHLIGIVDAHYIQSSSHQQLLAQFLNGENEFCPDGVNVSYVYPMRDDTIFVRTYERGVGFTNACGTAMTASALVAYRNKLVNDQKVTVFNPGGFVQCHVKQLGENYALTLVGNATVIAIYTLQHVANDWTFVASEQTGEVADYEKCIEYAEEQTRLFLVKN
ncbi:MAG: diaminopimelate epimerase [Solibacillus sp.]